MAYTGMTEYEAAAMTLHEQSLLNTAAGYLVAPRFAWTKAVKSGHNTYRFSRMLRATKTAAARSEGSLFGHASARALEANKKEVTPEKWGDAWGFSMETKFEQWIADKDNREAIANQMARTMEFQTIKTMTLGSLWHRVDFDATYEQSGTASVGGGANTTTVTESAGTFGEADNFWINGMLCFTSPYGPNYDEARRITDSDQSDTDVDHAAFPHAATTSSSFKVTESTDITAADVITTAALTEVMAMHRKLETEAFPGFTMKAFVDAEQEEDLMADATWVDSAKYDDSGRFKNYRLVRWFGIEFAIASELYRMDADGTENQSSGAVHCALIFGMKSYGVLDWTTAGINNNIFGMDWKLTKDTDSNNLLGDMYWLGWAGLSARTVLRATSIVTLLTGASAGGAASVIVW